MKSTVQTCLLLMLLPLFSGFTRPSAATEPTGQGPLITATASTTTYCKVGKTCGTWVANLKKWHGVKITLTGASISHYKSNMVYSIQGTNITFPCTQSVVELADGQLKDNTTYTVTIKDAKSSSSGAVTFKTGTGAGTLCSSGGGGTAKNRN
jgi:hypothetical protein